MTYALTDCPIDSIISFGAKPCGSRYVIEGAEVENSDYDFFISSADIDAFKREFPQFQYIDFKCSPMEEAVGDLLLKHVERKNYADLYTLGIFKAEIDGKKIEVTVKETKYVPAIILMWDVLKANPEMFRKKIWKRNISKEWIQQNISILIEALHIE